MGEKRWVGCEIERVGCEMLFETMEHELVVPLSMLLFAHSAKGRQTSASTPDDASPAQCELDCIHSPVSS
jgi:hypothetical protein